MTRFRFLFKPKWIAFHLLVIAMIVLMVNLGFWQKHRLESRREFNSEVRARSAEPIVPIEAIVAGSPGGSPQDIVPADVQWRTITAIGTYLRDEQVLIVNRSQGGATGVNVVTPLQLSDGQLVLINRGFVPDTADVPPPATGEVEVTGRLRATQRRSLGGLTEPDGQLTELFRVDIPRLAEQLPGPVLPVYVDLLAAEPAQGAIPIPLPDPELGEGSHLSYMVQWWIFSICVAVGWVFAVRRSILQHQRDLLQGDLLQRDQIELSATTEPAMQGSSSSTGDASATTPG